MTPMQSRFVRAAFAALSRLLDQQNQANAKKTALPRLEALEERWVPAVLNPTRFDDPSGPHAGMSLRDAITIANNNSNPVNTINLKTGTYNLTYGGRLENSNVTGDLDIDPFAHGGTFQFVGQGAGKTFINANSIDRAFHILPSNDAVVFKNLTIKNGLAEDNGYGGGVAQGGAILNAFGSKLTLSHVTLSGNLAQGAAGADGTNIDIQATSGSSAYGGGIYQYGGTLTIKDSSKLTSNKALGGKGGNGGFNASNGHTGGAGAGGSASGGGVYAQNTVVSITSTSFISNVAQAGDGGVGNESGGGFGEAQAIGGGIAAFNSALTITGSNFRSNIAQGGAGKILTVSGGGANANGGGAFGGALLFIDSSQTLKIRTTTIDSNSALGGHGGTAASPFSEGLNGGEAEGGGAYIASASKASIGTSTISRNTATGGVGGTGGNDTSEFGNGGTGGPGGFASGGGLFSGFSTKLTVFNSTISTNTAQGGAGGTGGLGGEFGNAGSGGSGGFAAGGAVGGEGGDPIQLTNITVAFNQALAGQGGAIGDSNAGNARTGSPGTAYGGGIFINEGEQVISNNSIYSNNTANVGPDAFGTFSSGQDTPASFNNLISDDSGSSGLLAANGNLLNNKNAKLGPLQNNGGPTFTHFLKPGSAAINKGKNSLAVDGDGKKLISDQRGLPRIVNGIVDIGAVEVQAIEVNLNDLGRDFG